jgi:Bacteriocin-protection, YdeI or OmpD-Associated
VFFEHRLERAGVSVQVEQPAFEIGERVGQQLPGVRDLDHVAPFYRRAYLRWIHATKRSPALRAERIAVVVALLERGVKERP